MFSTIKDLKHIGRGSVTSAPCRRTGGANVGTRIGACVGGTQGCTTGAGVGLMSKIAGDEG